MTTFILIACVLEMAAVRLSFGFLSPSLGAAAALSLATTPRVAMLAVTLALVLRTVLRGSPTFKLRLLEFASDLVPAALGTVGLALPVLVLTAVVRRQDGLSAERLTLGGLGLFPPHALALALSLAVCWGARTRLEILRQQHSRQALREERTSLGQERELVVRARAEAFAMLQRLSRPRLAECLALIAERVPESACYCYGPQRELLAAVGTPLAQGVEATWPLPEGCVLWLQAPVRWPTEVDLFIGSLPPVLERLRQYERERTLLRAAPQLAATTVPGDVLELGTAIASDLAGGRAAGVTAAEPPVGTWSIRLGKLGHLWVQGSPEPPQQEVLELWSCLIEAALERIQAQSGLMHSSKLAAIGQLAGGVAHELNTPLGAVCIAVEVALHSVTTRPERAVSRLTSATETLERMKSIINGLLSFSRAGRHRRGPVCLAQVARDSLLLVENAFRTDGIELATELQPAPCEGDAGELQQVLVNLLVNARQAVLAPAARARRVAVRTGPGFAEVEDWGAGVPTEIADRIFEPFFTTRDVNQGTGLGLSISHEIAIAHGGRLDYHDTGQGALFRLELA